MLQSFRAHDRSSQPYPLLKFPKLYLLKGGYRAFNKNPLNRNLCGSYVTMLEPKFRDEFLELVKKY